MRHRIRAAQSYRQASRQALMRHLLAPSNAFVWTVGHCARTPEEECKKLVNNNQLAQGRIARIDWARGRPR